LLNDFRAPPALIAGLRCPRALAEEGDGAALRARGRYGTEHEGGGDGYSRPEPPKDGRRRSARRPRL